MTIRVYELVGSDPQRPFSPHCWKIVWALAHKGLAYERVPTPYAAIAGIGNGGVRTLPAIHDGDRLLSDSFAIALYLDEAFPERPSLFRGEGGQAMARFIERWTNLTLNGYVVQALLTEIHDCLAPADQAYFRASREKRFGRPLEEVPKGREERLDAFRMSLEPMRNTLAVQPYLGGDSPLFCDYIVAGTFQWARVISRFPLLESADPVAEWFARCLDMYDGMARKVPAAA